MNVIGTGDRPKFISSVGVRQVGVEESSCIPFVMYDPSLHRHGILLIVIIIRCKKPELSCVLSKRNSTMDNPTLHMGTEYIEVSGGVYVKKTNKGRTSPTIGGRS